MMKMQNRPAPRLRRLNYLIIGAAAVIAFFLLYTTLRTMGSYDALQQDTERYIHAQDAAKEMRDASDYLTHQVQLYTTTGNWTYVENYFREAETTRRRDGAVASIRELTSDRDSLAYLEDAMEHSVALMDVEYRAIRLVLEAQENAPARVPDEVSAVVLTQEERAAAPGEKMIRARELVFGFDYLSEKDAIYQDVQQCASRLTKATRDYQLSSAGKLYGMLIIEQVLIILLLILTLTLCVLTSRLLIVPMEHNVRRVQAAQPMELSGSYEMQFMARSYNEMYERTRKDREQLSYEATHDPLTGVGNRKELEAALKKHDESTLAMIMLDVDDFKSCNDRYGHEIGDKVLKRVASTLRESFRSEDYICRIGGDEFIVLMVRATSSLKDLVERKIEHLREALRPPEGNAPGITLSIGIAFGDRENPQGSLYQDADLALYYVKGLGRDGYAFFNAAVMKSMADAARGKEKNRKKEIGR